MGLNQSNPKDEDRTIKEFDKVKDIVIRFLRDLPETRNSDKLLYYEIMKENFLKTDLSKSIDKYIFLDVSLGITYHITRQIYNGKSKETDTE
tara:strand:- start:315 stop:590 length:276 start_codon:yes stop_codon:yes gene_type:complete